MMHRIALYLLPLLCAACVTAGSGMNHYLVQDTRIAFDEGVHNNFKECAPVAFAEAEAYLMMASHEFSEGNMDRTDAQQLKEKADYFLQQAQQQCALALKLEEEAVQVVKKVEEKIEKKKGIAAIMKSHAIETQHSFQKSIYFNRNSFQLSVISMQTLKQVVQKIMDKNHVTILINGHADERGSDTNNQKISCARANVVILYLVKAGVHYKNIRHHCYGESKPMAGGHDESSWQQNRRVDIHITAKPHNQRNK